MMGVPDIATAVASIDEARLQPIVRKAADEFYESVMNAVQDSLRDNAEFNIGSYISTLECEKQSLRAEVQRQAGVVAKLVEALEAADGILRAVSTDWEAAQVKVIEALALAKGEAA